MVTAECVSLKEAESSPMTSALIVQCSLNISTALSLLASHLGQDDVIAAQVLHVNTAFTDILFGQLHYKFLCDLLMPMITD